MLDCPTFQSYVLLSFVSIIISLLVGALGSTRVSLHCTFHVLDSPVVSSGQQTYLLFLMDDCSCGFASGDLGSH